MKIKVLAIVAALALTATGANAQSDIFFGLGAGVISNYNDGFNAPAFYGQLQFGAYVTPLWGVRAVAGGPTQKLNIAGDTQKKNFLEIDADAIFNFSQWLSHSDLPKVDVYAFTGPTLNFATLGTCFTGEATPSRELVVESSNDFKTRVGATIGLGVAVNITPCLALGVEGRFGVTPSIFGDISSYRKAESTSRATINLMYYIGGKNGKSTFASRNAGKLGYISAAEAEALAAEAVAKNPRIIEKPVEKIVEKVVEKVVEKPVGVSSATTAFFFDINKAVVSTADKARIKLLAESIKSDSGNTVYEVAGYADKATGSVVTNNILSEKRAKAVYDLLVAEGVNPSRLEVVGKGGVGKMFFNSNALSRSVIVSGK